MFRERVIEFVTDLPKSPRDMAERLKKVPLWYKSASLITVASLAACQLGERFGFVTPPPESTQTPPTETIPPTDQASETKIFAGMLIGEAGIGMISGLTQEENPDPVFVSEIESRALEALRVEDANLDPERIKVYAFEMQGETGNAPFPLISVSDKDNPDKLLSVFAGFGVDANGVLVPPKGGKIAVLLRLTTVQSESESSLVYVGIQSREDPLAIYLPALFEVKQSADEIYFIPPYADSLGQSVPVRGGKYLFSPKPVEPTPTPEAVLPTMSQEQIGANIDSFLQRTPEMTFLTVKEEKRLFRDSYSSSTIKILPIGYYEISSKLNDNRAVFPVPGKCQGVLLGYRAFENKDVFVIYVGLENLKTNERLVVPFWMFRIAPNEQPWLNYLPPLYIQNVYPPDWGWVNGTQRLITGEPREVLSNLRLALLQPVEIAFEFGFNKTFTGYEKMSEATYQSLSGSGNAGFALVNWMEGVGPAPQYDYQNPDINSMPANDTLVLPHPQNNQ